MNRYPSNASRREFLLICAAVGVVSSFFTGALCALAATKREQRITGETIDEAAALAGIEIPLDKKQAMLAKLNEQLGAYDAVRHLRLPNDLPPAFRFDPLISGGRSPATESVPVRNPAVLSEPPTIADDEIPRDLEKLAFATVRELGALMQRQKISAADLTEMYLARLKRFNPQLNFLITLTEERARAQATSLMSSLERAGIEDRCMGSRGEQKTCWLCAVTRRRGAQEDFSSRLSTTTQPS